MDYKTRINAGISRLRAKNHLSQEAFAEKLELNVETIKNIDQNRTTPRAKTIDVICEKFNIRPIDLLFDSPTDDVKSIKDLINDKLNAYSVNELLIINEILDSLEKFYINKSHLKF